MSEANPLLTKRFEIDWRAIKPEHVEPAVEALLERARADVEAIAAADGPRTYDNTIGALERATEVLEYAMATVGHLESTVTTDALRAAYNAVQPPVAQFYAGIPLHEGLWRALQDFAKTDEAEDLDPPRRRHVTKLLDDFRRHGAELDDDGKRRLERLDVELAQLTTKFAQNVLDATNAWEHIITHDADLAGLPESAIAAAKASAAAKGSDGWRFTLQAPSYIPLLTYLDNAAIRERAYRAFNTRASSGDHDNRGLVADILRLRGAKATLLGYASFADLVLEDRMAGSGARARRFVDELREKAEAGFTQENEDLLAFRRELEGASAPALQPWDVAYYSEKQRRARYAFDEEALRPYFAFDAVLRGVFSTAERLYGVSIERDDSLPCWHDDVRAFRLRDGEHRLGAFYVDPFPRESKRDGAWMHGLISGVVRVGEAQPHLGIVCANVTPPVGDTPALVTHREVETLFHEFGHLMHHCLSRVTVRSLGGTNVAWDFVELPSQIMENWCWERQALDVFARHHETHAELPAELFEPMAKARTFRAANAMMRQLGFAAVDLSLHIDYDAARDGDAFEYARAILAKHSPAPLPDDYAMIASFSHLFAHPVGYGAAYYSYKWAEVLDADAFSRFRNDGIFSRRIGQEFRQKILARGDTKDPMELYKDFMGREPKVEPLLQRAGLLG